MDCQLEKIVDIVYREILNKVNGLGYVEIEASGRHVHMSREVVEELFGKGYQLTKVKELSQPGQFACKERVTIVGPKGKVSNVVILGPERENTQIEVSKTDAKLLGIDAPTKESGKITGTPGIEISANGKTIALESGVIVAERHIHMKPEDAQKLSLKDNEYVDIEVVSERPVVFKNVKVRVSDKANTFMHIDFDEANACGLSVKTYGLIKTNS
ncbi:phosphate propanoyltransferase [Alkalibaculum sp. M08DMB]|uniref:Phosphate propanoyltransferase n=1 Tax=Alkalibaculum sporogenes TaxID=2655001 RepID=A0A6A7K885_9FIRM|nr:phosphate propanoyltransferase [Alkalibaculum sporogenes]MPW25531.1 phosphate propanoyltransferase [Alkalibaculum sporogenes]